MDESEAVDALLSLASHKTFDIEPWSLVSPMLDNRSFSWTVRCNQSALAS